MIALSGNPEGRDDTVLAFKKLRNQWPRLKVAVSAGAESVSQVFVRGKAGLQVDDDDGDDD